MQDERSAEELVALVGVTRTVVLPDDQELHILRGINLRVHSGDHTAIIGRSGCGKSTLLNLLGLLDLPTTGELTFQGEPGEKAAQQRPGNTEGQRRRLCFPAVQPAAWTQRAG